MRLRQRKAPYIKLVSPAAMVTTEILAADNEWRARRNIGAYDDLPYEVRVAVSNCPFLVDITRAPNPRNFDYRIVVERINAVSTFEDAKELDRWLLECGLRGKR